MDLFYAFMITFKTTIVTYKDWIYLCPFCVSKLHRNKVKGKNKKKRKKGKNSFSSNIKIFVKIYWRQDLQEKAKKKKNQWKTTPIQTPKPNHKNLKSSYVKEQNLTQNPKTFPLASKCVYNVCVKVGETVMLCMKR